MMRFAIDSVIFIYAVEDNGPLGEASYRLLSEIETGSHSAIASVLCLNEVLTKPFTVSAEDGDAMQRYMEDLNHIDYIKVDEEVAIISAKLRATHGSKLRLADSIHVATAIHSRVDAFVTNDFALAKLKFDDIKIQLISDFA